MLKTSAKLSFDSEADTYFPSAPFPHVKMQMMAGTVRPGHGGDHARQRLGPSCGEGAPPAPPGPAVSRQVSRQVSLGHWGGSRPLS